ncbi:MAG: 2-oxoglutarate ferredoxin oxidoreductase subunit beta [Deltaproteobacteria bacterium RIFCSPLOWO2_01_44_7]|nr:MAG: 2-oxoglutarate ferredoxin oxidoreductase subunit beta [Deltaproteobacteria bacterium RIFCSPHIGHO2_01_FULL_43_49]OGQ16231.1 MAG: 2-oxoglutarate ferredoxin oxidoreductase subunit beta [Deltaproteobacteria bacterium RIFCSPHIGHO2_02_FULL_44_53]OGQ29191.1 MAG: 2-oxoglutarate ferredoxin oxidoreductase subunit beta [Deltaproteobacteria bacterium RIFCSPHIGHO2_12_FULL_44_21]OGQ32748.1 MAG: 2-oxoglutarate ferredoxin oxidoreductase subunit beta [Deltaproteobacteria bacterium RIFCSPLOWO2_01_FULL_45_
MAEPQSQTTPSQPAQPKTNRLGLTRQQYTGSPSTLCPGCGHDSITSSLITACFELGVDPVDLIKMSGIGCSSKTPAYFMSQSFAFNAVHGRMPSVATGALLANRELKCIGISGDGDTASIGMGQFVHLLRRNVPMLYIIENNGVYGLTKGQFSATADLGSKLKSGLANEFPPVDCCALAIELGCNYVVRSFSGDNKQLVPLIKAALSHKGTALLDVISPCITFNNHEGSTMSYDAVRAHDIPLHEIGFVPHFEPIQADFEPGTTKDIVLPDGSHIRLKKLNRDYDPTNKLLALKTLAESKEKGELLTGLIYIQEGKPDYNELMHLSDTPLAHLTEKELKPTPAALQEIMQELM